MTDVVQEGWPGKMIYSFHLNLAFPGLKMVKVSIESLKN